MIGETQLNRFRLFDAKVPRYTSYPTAPQFSPAVDAATHVSWIEAIPEGAQISLYLHVPFCRRLCWFCACRTQGTQSDRPVAAYLEVLKSELALLRQHLPAGVTLSRLHWGGGTPTLLSPGMMSELAAAIAEVAPFAEGYEFSVEIDPNEIDAARVAALHRAGLNRASIGVQDFDLEIQKSIGREQSYDQTRDAIDLIRAHGVQSLNADILYGLPHQTPDRITASVQKLLSLSPDRVALYGYAHVPWMARRQSLLPSNALPTPAERLNLFETAQKLFLWDGYAEIGIDHFALPSDGLATAQRDGRLRRNFQGYTDDPAEVLIGIGASSISRFPQGYAQNAPATSAHTGAIREGRFSVCRGHSLTKDDLLRGRIIEALMCDFAVRVDDLTARFAVNPTDLRAMFDAANAAFEGILEVDAEGLRIPAPSRPLTRMIASQFDAYSMNTARHSSAI
ncbi:oxygen-independent coproporphyrinogen III oxidase [Pseudooceanicola sp.]|uniref:oxygen-independent coproporphyrinogen III oxidase n=1 Tax=Pseudooceanicola sp. TaxID=1914328 RepID=UPI0026251F87|nr:oxygen-independent coproporphyrinogen III oxidase [Pseudooceanicola sp.]MDF1856696.1 oxygen-independent coproporphyrinogen III oxidase [Pseudooceanicola sp.]